MVNKDQRSLALYNHLKFKKPPTMLGISTPATIRNGFQSNQQTTDMWPKKRVSLYDYRGAELLKTTQTLLQVIAIK